MSIIREKRLGPAWDAAQAREANELNRDTVGIVNGGMRIADQFSGLKTGVRWNSDDAPISVGPFPRPVRWVVCLGARLFDAPSSVVSTPAVEWTFIGENVSITAIQGLTSGVAYTIDLLCMEG